VKAKGTLHWVDKESSVAAEVRLYDRLFSDENPLGHEDKDFLEFINPESLNVISNARIEPGLLQSKAGDKFQFLRLGYFCVDRDSSEGALVFNRTVALRDSWGKAKGAGD
jgi:glutaminyl-tRNA synthetase